MAKTRSSNIPRAKCQTRSQGTKPNGKPAQAQKDVLVAVHVPIRRPETRQSSAAIRKERRLAGNGRSLRDDAHPDRHRTPKAASNRALGSFNGPHSLSRARPPNSPQMLTTDGSKPTAVNYVSKTAEATVSTSLRMTRAVAKSRLADASKDVESKQRAKEAVVATRKSERCANNKKKEETTGNSPSSRGAESNVVEVRGGNIPNPHVKGTPEWSHFEVGKARNMPPMTDFEAEWVISEITAYPCKVNGVCTCD